MVYIYKGEKKYLGRIFGPHISNIPIQHLLMFKSNIHTSSHARDTNTCLC